MSKHEARVTLHQLRDAAIEAQDMCADRTADMLRTDRILLPAVKRLPLDLRERYPEVAWKRWLAHVT